MRFLSSLSLTAVILASLGHGPWPRVIVKLAGSRRGRIKLRVQTHLRPAHVDSGAIARCVGFASPFCLLVFIGCLNWLKIVCGAPAPLWSMLVVNATLILLQCFLAVLSTDLLIQVGRWHLVTWIIVLLAHLNGRRGSFNWAEWLRHVIMLNLACQCLLLHMVIEFLVQLGDNDQLRGVWLRYAHDLPLPGAVLGCSSSFIHLMVDCLLAYEQDRTTIWNGLVSIMIRSLRRNRRQNCSHRPNMLRRLV